MSLTSTEEGTTLLKVHLFASKSVFFLSVSSVIFAIFVGIFRLFDSTPLEHFNKFINPIILIISIVSLLTLRRIKFDFLSWIMLFMIIQGAIFASFYDTSLRYYVSHLFSSIFAFSVFLSARNFNWDLIYVKKVLYRTAKIFVGFFFAALSIFWILRFFSEKQLYLGVSATSILLPISIALVEKKILFFTLCSLLVFVSGKRGVMLGLIWSLYFVLPFLEIKTLSLSLRLLILIITIPVVSTLLFWILGYVGIYVDYTSIPIVGDVISKILLLDFLQSDFGLAKLDLATGGRWSEISYSFDHFLSRPIFLITGGGFGWTFDTPYSKYSDTQHYVHFSPLNYLYQYGVITFLLFFSTLIYKLFVQYRLVVYRCKTVSILWLTLSAWLIVGFTGYSYAIDPLIWIFLGLFVNISEQYYSQLQLNDCKVHTLTA